MDFATTTIYMFTLVFTISIGAIIFLEIYYKKKEEKVRADLKKRFPALRKYL